MLDNRFWSKVRTSDSHFYKDTPCLEWTAFIDPGGYGKFWLNGKTDLAHRVSYEDVKGMISEDLELDHLCRNRCCINFNHLQAIPHKENMKRGLSGLYNLIKTHCPKGHEYTQENTYILTGKRYCRTCNRIQCNQYRQRKKLLTTF